METTPMAIRTRAFTLIELLAVMVILGLLAGSVTLRLVGLLDQRTLEDGVGAIRHLDGMTRSRATSSGRPMNLRFDLAKQSLVIREGENVISTWHAGKLRLESVRQANARFTEGEVIVPCSPSGMSPSYAVKLTSKSGQKFCWVMVAGLSGDVKEVEDEKQLVEFFKTEERHDTD